MNNPLYSLWMPLRSHRVHESYFMVKLYVDLGVSKLSDFACSPFCAVTFGAKTAAAAAPSHYGEVDLADRRRRRRRSSGMRGTVRFRGGPNFPDGQTEGRTEASPEILIFWVMYF